MSFNFFSKLVKKVQDKPSYIRVQILWVSVTIAMIVIFSLWLINMKSNVISSFDKTEKQIEETKLPSLFSSLKETVSNAIDSFRKKEEREPVEENEEDAVEPAKLPR